MIVHRQLLSAGPLKEGEELQMYPPEHSRNSALTQHAIMDHLQEAAGKFDPNAPDLVDMLAPPGPGNGVGSVYQPHLVQQQVLPLQIMAPFSEDVSSPPEELDSDHFNLIHGYMYDSAGLHEEEEELVHPKMALEDSPALTPPSPFRDSVGSGSSVPSSPASESVLCTPPSVTYASVIMRDYKQSSSTL
ncbi:hypothetical protein AGOR_G00085190 [Albula goreensis]|uniref:Metabotropic glutamate receptor Homer-binding domain-containing protein n=1 Tax=Albula goreensis TaxID=1534307 RepID=A0A8T3DTR4_9TELE|nr:hypothetical protein AGOR_G00085190 [Albula goreensis]